VGGSQGRENNTTVSVSEHYSSSCFCLKHETFWRLDSVSASGERNSSIEWAQLRRYHLKPETDSSLQNAVLNKNRAMDNVQKHNNCINTPSSQTFRREIHLKMTIKKKEKQRRCSLMLSSYLITVLAPQRAVQ
jgi:hypothetical protein